jgi:hypothetical protein
MPSRFDVFVGQAGSLRPIVNRPGRQRAEAAQSIFLISLALFLCLPADAQTPREIVQRAVALDHANSMRVREFTYRQRQQERQFDASGKLKLTTIRTWDISFLEGSPYRRLVARNDQPLSPDERKSEDDRLRYTADQRRTEPKADRDKRVGEWERRQRKQREPVLEVPDAFDFKMAAEETVAGEPAYVIDAAPKPGYQPRSSSGSYLPKMKARFWISKKDSQWLKMEAETLDTIAFGGILIRLAKGSTLSVEQARVDGGLCLPTRFVIRATARVALFKVYRTEIEYTLGDYRRSAAVRDGAGNSQ